MIGAAGAIDGCLLIPHTTDLSEHYLRFSETFTFSSISQHCNIATLQATSKGLSRPLDKACRSPLLQSFPIVSKELLSFLLLKSK